MTPLAALTEASTSAGSARCPCSSSSMGAGSSHAIGASSAEFAAESDGLHPGSSDARVLRLQVVHPLWHHRQLQEMRRMGGLRPACCLLKLLAPHVWRPNPAISTGRHGNAGEVLPDLPHLCRWQGNRTADGPTVQLKPLHCDLSNIPRTVSCFGLCSSVQGNTLTHPVNLFVAYYSESRLVAARAKVLSYPGASCCSPGLSRTLSNDAMNSVRPTTCQSLTNKSAARSQQSAVNSAAHIG